jgi:CheY-like chemotaxis protein
MMIRFASRPNFPLCHRPAGVAFIDDEPDYLRSIAMLQPDAQYTRYFLSPRECIAHFKKDIDRQNADLWEQQCLINKWNQGAGLIGLILEYWKTAHERYDFMQILLVDFAMPAMNGLELLSHIAEWQGSRVLLTGHATEHLAVDAFNSGGIDQYIPKQTANMAGHVGAVVKKLLAVRNERRDQIWRNTFTPEQIRLLEQPATAIALTEFADAHWIEHIAIGSPFGILGYDANGAVSWLQLETLESRAGIVEIIESLETPGDWQAVAKDVAAGKSIVNVEMDMSLNGNGQFVTKPSFPIGSDSVTAALFDLAPGIGPVDELSYAHWLKTRPTNSVPD